MSAPMLLERRVLMAPDWSPVALIEIPWSVTTTKLEEDNSTYCGFDLSKNLPFPSSRALDLTVLGVMKPME